MITDDINKFQGSNLRPLLFVLYIYDRRPQSLENWSINMYVNDTVTNFTLFAPLW